MKRLRRLAIVSLMVGAIVLTLGAPAQAAISTIRYGSTGSSVVIWQKDLNFWLTFEQTFYRSSCGAGWAPRSIAVDGKFGPATDAVTRCFQNFVNVRYRFGQTDIAVDGIVGPITRGYMCRYLDGYASPSEPHARDLLQATCG